MLPTLLIVQLPSMLVRVYSVSGKLVAVMAMSTSVKGKEALSLVAAVLLLTSPSCSTTVPLLYFFTSMDLP